MGFRIAQLGAGRMGSLHAANAAAHPDLDLVYIVDPNAARAGAIARDSGAIPATLDRILGDSDISGVMVASATDAHLSDTRACLEAGKAVFCEKPLDLDSARLQAIGNRFDRRDTPPLFVAFNRRFDDHFAALKQRLDDGAIGALETLHIVNHDPAPPAVDFIPGSGGLFRDFSIHDFDLVRWLTGDEVHEIFAWGSCLIDPAIGAAGDVDTAKIILRSRGGVLCVISNNRRTGYGYDQRIEAFGASGALRVDNILQSGVATWRDGGSTSAPLLYGFADRYAAAYRREMDHFADILKGLAAPRTGFYDSLAALRLADAADHSARTGTLVTLDVETNDDA